MIGFAERRAAVAGGGFGGAVCWLGGCAGSGCDGCCWELLGSGWSGGEQGEGQAAATGCGCCAPCVEIERVG